jgi:Zn-dependent M28 family amino/carboxypeptidase
MIEPLLVFHKEGAMIRIRSRFLAYVAILLFCPLLLAQSPEAVPQAPTQTALQASERTREQRDAYRKAMEEADQKIADEVKAHSELMTNLEYLTTQIGPRLTGSPQMQAASAWTRKRFQDYHLEAHLETAEIAHGWTRGVETAEITSPIQRRIGIHALGWSKATDGEITGKVVVLNIKGPSDFDQYKGKLKGAIILMRRPADLSKAEANPENAYDAVIPPSRGVPQANGGWRGRMQLMKQIAAEQPALMLMDSGKPDSLFNMTGGFNRYSASDAPMAFLTHEDYDLIYRLLQAGAVTMTANLQETFSDKPVPASITVAEIKGSEHPEERVIVGGHLDSWDLGQGALDNGTGAMATLEAARALQALGWKPKRTITFILFTGEEQGGIGADTFLKNHAAEIPAIDAVLIHDTGTGKVFSISLNDLWETAALMHEIYQPLQEVFDLQPLSTRYFGSSDHVPFLNKGVPAYFCVQLPAQYREAHHSQTDTFDKVVPDQINEGAAFLAAWAWNVSEMPQALPHHAEPTEPMD